uniref:SHSP domain-containing protein n=1 Tax=Araucaria cunninghamii TaxID=56994 RepID=A0A0D6R3W5_ARACU
MAAYQEARAIGSGSGSSTFSVVERPRKPMTEELFRSFFSPRRNVLDTFFRSGYLFSPFLFGSFMDPSEPFHLWNYTPYNMWPKETVSLSKSIVDWFETDDSIILCADLPGLKKHDLNVSVENGRTLKISGLWNHKVEDMQEADRSGEWWKVEYMRRFILPENANIEHARARIDDGVLDVKILKNKAVKGVASPALKVVEVTDK